MSREQLTLTFGGFSFRITVRESWLADVVRDRYEGFLDQPTLEATPQKSTEVELQLCTALDQPGAAATRYTVRRQPGDPVLHIDSGLLEGTLDPGTSCGQVGVLDGGHPELGRVAPGQALENYLRIVTAVLAPGTRRALVHGAALVREDGASAVLCCGPSGAGKSTLAHLATQENRVVLGDDLALVELGAAGRPVVSATPFWGDQPPGPRHRHSYPLAGLFELHQSPRHACEELPPGEAIACLIASIPFQGFMERRQIEEMVDLAERLMHDLPSRRLSFRPDAAALDVLEDSLR